MASLAKKIKDSEQELAEMSASKGDRYIRKIHFSKFLKAAYGPNTSNAALALLLDVDASTIPRLQKTCAGIFMVSQLNTVSKRVLILDSLI